MPKLRCFAALGSEMISKATVGSMYSVSALLKTPGQYRRLLELVEEARSQRAKLAVGAQAGTWAVWALVLHLSSLCVPASAAQQPTRY